MPGRCAAPPAPAAVEGEGLGWALSRRFRMRLEEPAAATKHHGAGEPPRLALFSASGPDAEIRELACRIGERLAAVTPGNLNFVKPFSGGSESIEAALKFTRQYFKQTGHPGKYKFISRYFGYHGGTLGAMSASGTGPRKTPFEPQMAGFLKVFPPTWHRDQFASWEECNRFSARMFEDVIRNEDPETVAGIIVEPIGNTGGIITPTDEYFQILREIADRYNVLLIFDEIITGFARTGRMFAAQTFGVTPDILCGGKGLSSGMIPLGALMAREDMGDAFLGPAGADVNCAQGHTFAGNPLACAGGLAVLEEIAGLDPTLLTPLEALTKLEELRKRLERKGKEKKRDKGKKKKSK